MIIAIANVMTQEAPIKIDTRWNFRFLRFRFLWEIFELPISTLSLFILISLNLNWKLNLSIIDFSFWEKVVSSQFNMLPSQFNSHAFLIILYKRGVNGVSASRFFGHSIRDNPRKCLIFSEHIKMVYIRNISKN